MYYLNLSKVWSFILNIFHRSSLTLFINKPNQGKNIKNLVIYKWYAKIWTLKLNITALKQFSIFKLSFLKRSFYWEFYSIFLSSIYFVVIIAIFLELDYIFFIFLLFNSFFSFSENFIISFFIFIYFHSCIFDRLQSPFYLHYHPFFYSFIFYLLRFLFHLQYLRFVFIVLLAILWEFYFNFIILR